MTARVAAPRVIIIGGGITGLSAAWRLQAQAPFDLEISVLEASDRWGGKVLTDELSVDGRRVAAEAGAESFVTRKPQVWDLAHELGLGDSIKAVSNEARGTYLLHKGQLEKVPLSPSAFLRTPLMTAAGKLRLLAEPFIPRKKDAADESLAEFARRRLGRQAADNFIVPILAGIYNADPERQSILTTSPVMRQMEEEYGSLFLAMLARATKPKTARANRPRFISFDGGTEQLISTLVNSINGSLRLNQLVQEVRKENGGYLVLTSSGQRLLADAVLLATPSNKTAPLLAGVAQQAANAMRQIRHADLGTLLVALPARLEQPRPGITGLMVPHRQAKLIDAVTWLSHQQAVPSSKEFEVIKIYFGGAAPDLMGREPSAVIDLLLAELSELLSIQVEALATSLHRWPQGYPQADVGHLQLVERIESQLPPGVFVAGSSYRGLAVPDCIRQANDTAVKIIRHLSKITTRKDTP